MKIQTTAQQNFEGIAMTQMTVADLRSALDGALAGVPGETPIYFRRVAPICGNVEAAGSAKLDQISAFGVLYPCVIFEPVAEQAPTWRGPQ